MASDPEFVQPVHILEPLEGIFGTIRAFNNNLGGGLLGDAISQSVGHLAGLGSMLASVPDRLGDEILRHQPIPLDLPGSDPTAFYRGSVHDPLREAPIVLRPGALNVEKPVGVRVAETVNSVAAILSGTATIQTLSRLNASKPAVQKGKRSGKAQVPKRAASASAFSKRRGTRG